MCSAIWHIPFSIIKKCLLRPIQELPSTVWKKVARTTVIKHCQNWLWPWMKFNFFIYYPKMPSGPYYTSRQPTSRIYMLRPSKAGYFLTRFRVLGLLPGGSAGNELTCNERDRGSISEWGRAPGEGQGSHSSVLAWRTPRTAPSMGLQRVGRAGATFTLTIADHYQLHPR